VLKVLTIRLKQNKEWIVTKEYSKIEEIKDITLEPFWSNVDIYEYKYEQGQENGGDYGPLILKTYNPIPIYKELEESK
jgi:hypothetical protein